MNGGRLILADEPGALDSESGAAVLSLFHDQHAMGHTIVIVTHDAAIARHADRIVEMRDRVIVGNTVTGVQDAAGPSLPKATTSCPLRHSRLEHRPAGGLRRDRNLGWRRVKP